MAGGRNGGSGGNGDEKRASRPQKSSETKATQSVTATDNITVASTVKTSQLSADSISVPKNGADVVVSALIRQGVDVVFAYPGGYSMPLHQAFMRQEQRIRVVLPRQEQGGGFAAQGYARSTGRPGVCMTTSGPGATNLVTAIADAKLDSVPVIFITGQVVRSVIGTDAFQEVPMTGLCRSITKHHYLVTDPADLPRIIREAFCIATTGRPGPVLIDIPRDVQLATMTIPDTSAEGLETFFSPPMKLPGYSTEVPQISDEQFAQLVEMIRTAKRPVIYAGGGIVTAGAASELTQFAKKSGIPVTTTLMGLGGYATDNPIDDPLYLHFPGMHGLVAANYAIHHCDLLLSFGVRFDDRVTGKVDRFAEQGRIVHVDIDPSEIGKIRAPNLGVIADIRQVLQKLIDTPDVRPEDTTAMDAWHTQILDWKRNDPFSFHKVNGWITSQMAIDKLWQMTRDRDDIIISTGVGQHQMWAAQFYHFRRTRRWLSSLGFGTMGFGLPGAIGAKIGNPNATVIDIDGDGSFQMNIQEMATCTCEKIPMKVLLLNNQHLGMVVQWEDRFYGGHRAHTYLGPIDHPEWRGQGDGLGPKDRFPDFVEIARGYGWDARSIAHVDELESSLRLMLESPRSFLLDVAVPYHEYVLPMIPPGGTIDQLIRN